MPSADTLQDAERWSDRALPSLTSYGLDGPRGDTREASPLWRALAPASGAGAGHAWECLGGGGARLGRPHGHELQHVGQRLGEMPTKG